MAGITLMVGGPVLSVDGMTSKDALAALRAIGGFVLFFTGLTINVGTGICHAKIIRELSKNATIESKKNENVEEKKPIIGNNKI
jgi:hypothetical protein